MQQPLTYFFQTLNSHEVFGNGQHWTQARVQVLPWQHDILKFSFFLYFFVQNGKIVERLVLLTIQQWISEIYTVGLIFCIFWA